MTEIDWTRLTGPDIRAVAARGNDGAGAQAPEPAVAFGSVLGQQTA